MLYDEHVSTDSGYVLVETRLEERDGATWVSGLCPYCWQRLAFHAPPPGTSMDACCPNGHALHLGEQTSEGSRTHPVH